MYKWFPFWKQHTHEARNIRDIPKGIHIIKVYQQIKNVKALRCYRRITIKAELTTASVCLRPSNNTKEHTQKKETVYVVFHCTLLSV